MSELSILEIPGCNQLADFSMPCAWFLCLFQRTWQLAAVSLSRPTFPRFQVSSTLTLLRCWVVCGMGSMTAKERGENTQMKLVGIWWTSLMLVSWRMKISEWNFRYINHSNISGCFQKNWYPQIIHLNRVFHYKPYINHLFWGTSIFVNIHLQRFDVAFYSKYADCEFGFQDSTRVQVLRLRTPFGCMNPSAQTVGVSPTKTFDYCGCK